MKDVNLGGKADMTRCPFPIDSYYTQYPLPDKFWMSEMFPFNEEPAWL